MGRERGKASVDLDWALLDSALTQSAVNFLTAALSSAQKPSFLGDVSVSDFSFGDISPEVHVLDIRDIYKEFLEVDDEDQLQPPPPLPVSLDEQRARGREAGAGGRAPTFFSRSNSIGDLQGMGEHYSASASGSNRNPLRRPIPNPQPSSSFFSPGLHGSFAAPSHSPYHSATPPLDSFDRSPSNDYPSPSSPPPTPSSPSSLHSAQPTSSSSAPSLQLHLRVSYTGNMQFGLSTSLLINYPSPAFMALPLKLLVTSLAFTGTFIVAFEGDRRRVHISILDPREEEGAEFLETSFAYAAGTRVPRTAGASLLSGAVVESEVGQAEKHVLKNVGKVEKFVLDVARGALESELVFPNFQTILF
ncbi:hypothetical protein P7C70_g7301, partial [Phenoliferia sp. Uapishka_3]